MISVPTTRWLSRSADPETLRSLCGRDGNLMESVLFARAAHALQRYLPLNKWKILRMFNFLCFIMFIQSSNSVIDWIIVNTCEWILQVWNVHWEPSSFTWNLNWLVVSNIFSVIYGIILPSWLSYFSEGLKPRTRLCFAFALRWSFRSWWIKPRPVHVWNLDAWNRGTLKPW